MLVGGTGRILKAGNEIKGLIYGFQFFYIIPDSSVVLNIGRVAEVHYRASVSLLLALLCLGISPGSTSGTFCGAGGLNYYWLDTKQSPDLLYFSLSSVSLPTSHLSLCLTTSGSTLRNYSWQWSGDHMRYKESALFAILSL